mgnify:CR=1 FL=1
MHPVPWRAYALLAASTSLVGSYVGLSKLLVAAFPVFLLAGPLPQGHQINQGMKAVVLPYTSSLELVGDSKANKGPVEWSKLIESSAESWRPQGPFVFTPTQKARDMTIGTDRGPFILGVAGQGAAQSAHVPAAPVQVHRPRRGNVRNVNVRTGQFAQQNVAGDV